jgi:DNA-directed RNA polymerase alpha subunit
VSYKVENTREGQVLDYDKLTMTVETNGAVTPEDAVAYAARILQDQLSVFVNFDEPRAAARKRSDCVQPGCCSRRSTSWNCRSVRPTA